MVFVTLGAALASWTVMVTAWQVLLYGPERFHIRPFPICRAILAQLPTPRGHSPVFAIFALPVVCVAMYVSQRGGTSTYGQLLVGVLGGAVLATGILIPGGEFKRRG